jgi:uncharacterized protein YjcR
LCKEDRKSKDRAMPAPLETDREQVRIVAVQIGVREAARQFGLSEETVKSWSKREGWLRDAQEKQEIVEQARAVKRESQGLPPRAPTAAEVLAKYGDNTRLALAKGISKGAQTVAEMDGQEVLMSAQQVQQLTKSAQVIHGWAQTVEHSLRLDVLASGQGMDQPVLDVDAQVVTGEDW